MTAGLTRDGEADRLLPVPAQWIGPYRLIERLGEGGMGVVHLALDQSGRAVAVKVLREHIAHDADARSRLKREVQTLARVQDARVAAVLDADTDGPRPYLVTRYVPGPSLDRVVAAEGPVQGEPLLRLGRGLSQALQSIHAVGVIHRDLKPANVLLLDGDPVVIDFGIAHVADDIRLTMTGLVMGTPGYLSPEVVEGAPVTEATDWWGWAATLAFAASGAPPFGRGPMDVVLDRVRRGQADLSGVDPLLVPLLQAALSPIAGVRPQAEEIIEALDRYAAGTPVTLSVPMSLPVHDATSPVEAPRAHLDPAEEPDWFETRADVQADLQPESRGGPGQPDPRIEMRARVGTLLAMMVAVLGVAAVWPVVAVALVILWSWCARLADRSVTSLVQRRYERGRRRRDVPLAVVLSPWHLVVSAAATLIALLLPASITVASTFSSALALVSWTGGDPQPGRSVPLAVGGFIGLLMAWWGPGGASLRRGSRSLVRGIGGGRTATAILVAAFLLLGSGLGLLAWTRHGQPDLWPWPNYGLPSLLPWFA